MGGGGAEGEAGGTPRGGARNAGGAGPGGAGPGGRGCGLARGAGGAAWGDEADNGFGEPDCDKWELRMDGRGDPEAERGLG